MTIDLSRVPARIFSDSEMTLFKLEGRMSYLPPRQTPEAGGQLGGAIGALLDGIHRTEEGVIAIDVGLQPGGVAQYAAENVVEVVAMPRPATRWTPSSGLDEALFQQLALSDVAHETADGDHFFIGIAFQRDRDQHGQQLVFPGPEGDLIILDMPRTQHGLNEPLPLMGAIKHLH